MTIRAALRVFYSLAPSYDTLNTCTCLVAEIGPWQLLPSRFFPKSLRVYLCLIVDDRIKGIQQRRNAADP